MKALITGISGFAGSHLAEYLIGRNMEVFGTIRPGNHLEHVSHLEHSVHTTECELNDPSAVQHLLAKVKPDLIFHLAAQSLVPASWEAPVETIMNNVAGQLNLFEAARHLKLDCKIQIACSSEEYGHVEPGEIPVKEENPLRPLSPYAVSKVAQDYLGYQYYKNFGMHIIRTRAFNHSGPRLGVSLVTSNFAKQIADIEKGKKPPVLLVGNLQAKRDFSDVRDVVRAYDLALEKGTPGECYNVASGVSVMIDDMLRILLSMSLINIRVVQDPDRLRPSDVPVLVGDYSKLHLATGWKPVIPLRQTLEDLLNYWRGQP